MIVAALCFWCFLIWCLTCDLCGLLACGLLRGFVLVWGFAAFAAFRLCDFCGLVFVCCDCFVALILFGFSVGCSFCGLP